MEAVLQALIAAAASFAFVSLLLAFLILLCRRTPKPRHPFGTPPPPQQTPAPPPPPAVAVAVADESFSFEPSLDRLSMSELAAATHGFAPDAIVGDGSFGFVYKALLPSGTTVAVKRLSTDAFHGLREFRAEMDTVGRVRHPNLARLLGYCTAGRDRALIYEFLDRGSLDQWLHSDSPGSTRLPWSTRLAIVRGVAAGLAFLHEECRPRIIHRDIKSSNVLLDAEFGPRIADFGLARRIESARSYVSTQPAGTAGYMPPEYRAGATAATTAADVYSFGALMVEVATGRRPSWPVRGEDGREASLLRWARGMVEQGRGLEIVDRLMEREWSIWEEKQIKGFLDVACRCTEECASKRPSMGEVVKLLDQL